MGIEPTSTAWKAVIIAIIRRPHFNRVGVPGFEPGLHAPKASVLPLHYTPKFNTRCAPRIP